MAKLTLVRGVPGSGKSTFARKNFQCVVLENDMLQIQNGEYVWAPETTKRAIEKIAEITEELLSAGIDVCIANTFTKRSYIEFYKKMAARHHAAFEVIRCTGEFKNIHNVPEGVLKSMREHFEDWDGEVKINPACY